MRISRFASFGLGAIASFAAGESADATTINFSVPAYSGPGASIVDPGTDWNLISVGGTTAAGTVASDGSPSSVGLIDTDPRNGVDNVYSHTVAGTIGLFSPFEYTFSATTQTDTLTGVSPGIYELYLYGVNGGYATDDTQFTASGSGTGGSVAISATDSNGGNSQTFVLGQNYVVLPVTVGTLGSTISFSYVGPGTNTAPDGDFNGLQLVSVPEPGSIGLLSLAAGGLLSNRLARKKIR